MNKASLKRASRMARSDHAAQCRSRNAPIALNAEGGKARVELRHSGRLALHIV